jgi:hypothetical protein
MKACDAARNLCVPVLPFGHHDGQGVKGVKLRAIRSLHRPLTMPVKINLNTLWGNQELTQQTGVGRLS